MLESVTMCDIKLVSSKDSRGSLALRGFDPIRDTSRVAHASLLVRSRLAEGQYGYIWEKAV